MKKLVLTFLIPVLFCAGCRTYVGSDDIYETGKPEVIESKSGSELSRGMILEVEDGKYILTFAERSVTRQREKAEKYYCGRRYYYLDKSHRQFHTYRTGGNLVINTHKGLGFVLFPLFLPLQWLYDARPFACFNWKLHGEHAPGIGYCIAYLPIVHLFCTPFLRPPYAYERAEYCDEEERTSPRLVRVTMRERLMPVFAPDPTCGEILISHGGQAVSKELSPDGKVEFGVEDFTNISLNDSPLEFVIVHRKWRQRWTIRSPLFVDPAALQDWNIFAGAEYDYFTRARALARMERMLGKKCCREYLHKLLYEEPNIRPIARAEVQVSGNPGASRH